MAGLHHALYGLIASLRKICVPNDFNQSKVEFSKRKQAFNVRFLVMGVPFHSQHFLDAMDKMIDEDLNGEEL